MSIWRVAGDTCKIKFWPPNWIPTRGQFSIMTLLSCWILITLLNFDTFLSHNSTDRRYGDGSEFHVELWSRVKIPRWIMTLGQNSTLNCDPNHRLQFNLGHNSTWNQDPVSQFNGESRPGVTIPREILIRVTIQRGIMTRVTIQRWVMTRGHNSTWNYDPGHSSTLNYDPKTWSQLNVESWLGVTIQRGIKTLGHNSTWNKDLGSQFKGGLNFIRRRGRNTMTPDSGVAIQHEKSVESWAQPVESRPHGSKFNGVKIQSYTGTGLMSSCYPRYPLCPGGGERAVHAKMGGMSLAVWQYNTGFILSYSQDHSLPFLRVI